MWSRILLAGLFASALASAAYAETEDAGPLAAGREARGGVQCSARNAADVNQMIEIEATDNADNVLGTAGPTTVAPGAELQLKLPFLTVRYKSITCRSVGELVISSSIASKFSGGDVIQAIEGGNLQ